MGGRCGCLLHAGRTLASIARDDITKERNADQIEEVARRCAGDPARPLVAAEVKEEAISATLGAVRGGSAVSGRARWLDGSSPEAAISRYQLGKKLRHFQKLLAVLPSDLIANASSVIVTTSNTPPSSSREEPH